MSISTDRAAKRAGRVLLPSYFVPKRYTLSLEPDLNTLVFANSTALIEFDVDPSQLDAAKKEKGEKEIRSVTLHARELEFHSASIVSINGKNVSHAAQEIQVVLTGEYTVTFVFGSDCPNLVDADADADAAVQSFALQVVYTGHLNNQMAGFYRSNYTNRHGETKLMASTQFESLDARRAFPCIDEPSAKATFVVQLTIASHLQALSNMPVRQLDSNQDDKTRYTFMETPRMSTYLLALCVGEFDVVSAYTDTAPPICVSVYTPPGKARTGQFALDTALHNLKTYNDFFDVPYPLPKLDMVAIPEFAMGAMENWGLVTYREVDLLIDPVTASNSQKQRVATVVAHELAHQWFGNLVTMAWWDDLWLNEGFASWCENYAVHQVYPTYEMWPQFTTTALAAALRLDALASSHAIQVPIRHAEEVEQVFDAISYCKGASVVRMCAAVLGMDAFRQGLQTYMKLYKGGNTETLDLWKAWREASGMPVEELMASWTEQMGFPYLTITSEEWKDDSVTLTVEQAWFLADGGASVSQEEREKKLWTIPILTCTASQGVQSDMVLMREKTATITIPLSSSSSSPNTEWIKLNAGQQVPMRVLLTETMMERLKPAILAGDSDGGGGLSAIDRASLLTDAYALVKAGHMKPAALIDLLQAYHQEDAYIVWSCLEAVLNGLDALLSEDEAVSAKFQAFCRHLVLNLLNKVGWEPQPNDNHLATLLRGTMVSLLSSFCATDETVQAEAKRRMDLFWKDPKDVQALPTEYRAAVFSIVLKGVTTTDKQEEATATYNQIKAYYQSAADNAEAKLVLNSLGSIANADLKRQTMEWSTSGEVKLQDFFYLMGSVSRSNKQGRDIAWTYFQRHFDTIVSLLEKASPSLLNAVIVMCGGGFCTTAKADEVKAFFEAHPLPQCTRKIAQTVETIAANGLFFDQLQQSPLMTEESFWETATAAIMATATTAATTTTA